MGRRFRDAGPFFTVEHPKRGALAIWGRGRDKSRARQDSHVADEHFHIQTKTERVGCESEVT